MKTPFLLALLLSLGGGAAAAEDVKPLRDFVGAIKQGLTMKCQSGPPLVGPGQTAEDRELTRLPYEMQCECLPAELDKAVESQGSSALAASVTKEQGLAFIRAPFATCGARLTRRTLVKQCPRDESIAADVAQRAAICGCIAESLAKLPDEELTEASMVAHRNFGKRARARAASAPEPQLEPDAIGDLVKACKANQR